MRALTFRQPFAELMFYGKIETRTHKTNYRGLVLICAGKSIFTKQQFVTLCGNQYERVNGIFQANKKDIMDFMGMAIGVAELVNCRPMTKEDEQKCFVQHEDNRYCWIFENVRRIKPFPFKGNLGLRKVSEEFVSKNVIYI